MSLRLTLLSAGYCTQGEHLAMKGGARREIQFPGTFALIEHPEAGVVLFDTGYAARFLDITEKFPYSLYRKATPVYFDDSQSAANQLRARGIAPEAVRHVFLSHFHGDHIAGAPDFPNATFLAYKAGYDRIKGLKGLSALRHAFLPGLLPPDFESRAEWLDNRQTLALSSAYAPFERGVDLFGDGSAIAIELPGHADGQFGLLLDTRPHAHFLVADACWVKEAYESLKLPHGLAQAIFTDKKRYRETLVSLQRFHERHPEIRIVPSHCRKTLQALETPAPATRGA